MRFYADIFTNFFDILTVSETKEECEQFIEVFYQTIKKSSSVENSSPAWFAMGWCQKQERRWKGLKGNPLDHKFDMEFLWGEGKTLVLIYPPDNRYEELFAELLGVESYGFWDNADKPEELTDEEWKKRKEEWEKALDSFGSPKFAGLNASLIKEVPVYTILRRDDFYDLIPDMDKRVDFVQEKTGKDGEEIREKLIPEPKREDFIKEYWS